MFGTLLLHCFCNPCNMEDVLWTWLFEGGIPELAECVDTVCWDGNGTCALHVAPEHSAGVVRSRVLESVVAALSTLDASVEATALVDGTIVVRASASCGSGGSKNRTVSPFVFEEAPATLALQFVSCGLKITGLPHQNTAPGLLRLGTSWNLASLLTSCPVFSRVSPFGVPRPPAGSTLAQARHQALAFDRRLQTLAMTSERWLDTASEAGVGTVLVEDGTKGTAASVFVMVAIDEEQDKLLRACSPAFGPLSAALLACLSERGAALCEGNAAGDRPLPCMLVHRVSSSSALPHATLFFIRWRPDRKAEEYTALFRRTLALLGSYTHRTAVKKESLSVQAAATGTPPTEREECAVSLASSIADVFACSVSTAFQQQLWSMLSCSGVGSGDVPAHNSVDTDVLCQRLVQAFLNI